MPTTLTVYGGMAAHRLPLVYRSQVRVIVAATSGAAARRACEAVGLRVTSTEWRHSWCDTGNDLELAVALASPGAVLYQPLNVRAVTGLAGVFVPWAWAWPDPEPVPEPGPCSDCGATMDACDRKLISKSYPCCGACHVRATHGDDDIEAAARRMAIKRAEVADRG